ncbi:MAG TPA: alpha-1,2-fucosyltransferase [Phycisphaerales bacterium]|nr:alpha-1,2-fucosyltransferase [Phycisphaerales bacterium]
MEPFGRHRRLIMKYISRKKPFEKRTYIEQEKKEFDPRLLHYRVNGRVYIDSLWQDERYFNDIEDVIRNDLKIIPPNDESNQKLSKQIRNSNSVAIHVRWFASPDSFPKSSKVNVCLEYYRYAIDKISSGISSPTYFLFSDHPENAGRMIGLKGKNIRCVCHNKDEATAYADIWLMSQCKHFIIANSTFSWWGAWLASNPNKIVLCPNFKGSWNFQRLVPKRWELIDS